MFLVVILVIAFSTIVFLLAFLYFYRIYKQLKIRHLKPIIAPPGTIPASLEQHQELAFVLTHGVEAYNELRRERQRRERAFATATDAHTTTAVTNQDGTITITTTTRRHADASSLRSSSSAGGISVEAPPAYSSEPVDGDIGYGWRAAGLGPEQNLFAAPTLTGTFTSSFTTTTTTTTTTTSFDPLLHPLSPAPTAGSIMIPLDLLPPVYRYQVPSTRSSVQAALVSTDNSPSVTLPSRNRRRSSQQRATTTITTTTATATTEPRPQPRRQSSEISQTSQTTQSSQSRTHSPSLMPLPLSPPLSPPPSSPTIINQSVWSESSPVSEFLLGANSTAPLVEASNNTIAVTEENSAVTVEESTAVVTTSATTE